MCRSLNDSSCYKSKDYAYLLLVLHFWHHASTALVYSLSHSFYDNRRKTGILVDLRFFEVYWTIDKALKEPLSRFEKRIPTILLHLTIKPA